MKKLLLVAMMSVAFIATAKEKKDDTAYLRGAVPMENNIVTFRKGFKVKDMKKDEIYKMMVGYVNHSLIGAGTGSVRNRIITDNATEGQLIARVEEWMLFKKIKIIMRDEVRFRYTFTCNVEDEHLSLSINQISYLADENIDQDNKPTGEGGITYVAEEWIDDSHALNKKGTKLTLGSAKYRRKTVDRVNAIFQQVMDLFEEEVESQIKKQTEEKKQRKHITED